MTLHVTAVPFFRHDLSGQDASSIASVLNTPMLTSGAVGRKVEDQIAAFFGVSGALLTNSWTNGALTALFALGIGRGDEVIVPAMTFISSANVIEMVGATPVFVDVDPDTLLIVPEQVRAAVTPRTKAILPVHLYGQMCDVAALRAAIADRPDIRIIEDAAHCFEGSRNGHRPAAFGDIAIFSFYATKNITCGEGGAIAVRDEALISPLTQARLHGMTADAIDRYRNNRYRHWDMVRLGCKANLPDLLAVLLPSQIDAIESKLVTRRRLADAYRAAFADGPVRMPRQIENAVSAEHALVIHVPPAVRDDAIEALNVAGIGVGVHFRSVPSTTYYRTRYGFRNGDFPVSDAWGAGTISLPLYPSLTDDEQRYVIDAVREYVYPMCKHAQ
jgi:dTDP-4-amino-4,6-dideoxygalactose transaminase